MASEILACVLAAALGLGYSGYFQSLKRFNANPEGMTGRPQMPGYLDKHERFVLDIPFDMLGRGFPDPKAARVPEDDFVPEPAYLTPEKAYISKTITAGYGSGRPYAASISP